MTKDEIKEREGEKVMSDVIGQTRAGQLEEVPNLKKRQRAIYYRPIRHEDGTVEWLETLPLPSDAQGRELYLSKGFRRSPPTDEPTPDEGKADTLLAENAKLKKQLQMANARAAKGKKKEESLSGTL